MDCMYGNMVQMRNIKYYKSNLVQHGVLVVDVSPLLLDLALPPVLLTADPLERGGASEQPAPRVARGHHGDVVPAARHRGYVLALGARLLVLLFLLLAVRVLLPLDKNRINEEEVTHVEGEEADDAEDHDDDHLDDDGVPLLVSAHAPRAEGLGQPPHVLLLHIQARDDHVHAVAVAGRHVLDVYPPGLRLGRGGVDDLRVGTHALAAHVRVCRAMVPGHPCPQHQHGQHCRQGAHGLGWSPLTTPGLSHSVAMTGG